MKGYQVRGLIAKDEPDLSKKKGDEVWLYWSEEGGGWWQWGPKGWAYTFMNKLEAEKAPKGCPGPWYNVPDPETIEIVAGEYTPARKATFAPSKP